MAAKKSSVEKLQEEANKFQGQLSEKSREVWLAGLGLFSAAEQEGNKMFKEFAERGSNLVEKGENLEKKGIEYSKEVRDDVVNRVDDVVSFVEKKLQATLEAVGVSSSDEVKDLSHKVDKLTETVAALAKQLESANKK